MTEYAELHCHSYYSLLDGASSPEALVAEAAALGLHSLAITDHDSLAGAVRHWKAAQQYQLHAIFGAELSLIDGCHLTLLAETQAGYSNLSHLITLARLDQLPHDPAQKWLGKVDAKLSWEQLAHHSAGLIALSGCRKGPIATALLRDDPSATAAAILQLRECFGPSHLYVELQSNHEADDLWRNARLIETATQYALPVVATNNVHYAKAAGARLRDVLIATKHRCSLEEAYIAGLLPASSRYELVGPAAMEKRWRGLPQALRATLEIAERCQVSLDFSANRLPDYPTPDHPSEFALLYEHCHEQFYVRYPNFSPAVLSQLAHELRIIAAADLAGYFLLVWDIVRFAKERKIRCQGRGSAANSLVAYLLGITSVDPLAHHLLFERFLAEDRYTMPDIDLDFAADRREEVIQYVYQRYANHAAMACNVVTFRSRSAVRAIGKAIGLSKDAIDRFCRNLESYEPGAAADQLAAQLPADAAEHHPLRLLVDLLRQMDGCPHYLGIHSGGVVISGKPIAEIVPLEPATMEQRIVCQWDKDSLEDVGLVKIDLLSLRTLGLVSEACQRIEEMGEPALDLDRLPLDDPEIFAMLGRADTIGTFQIESRAQIQMLPRLRPTCIEDIAIEIGIVRPGPIQGGAVHPYLRRRRGEEAVTYLHPILEPILGETKGVLLFQEQAIRIVSEAAGFAPGKADLLRRTLSRTRPGTVLDELELLFIEGAVAKGIAQTDAQAIFEQLRGFAGYGFCKSHAMSFALIAYHTAFLKRYHAPAFYVALFNAQPMGFYSSEVIIGDAERHGVEILPPDIAVSDWRYQLERTTEQNWAIRIGLRAVKGLGENAWQQLAGARQSAPFADLADFVRRTQLPKTLISALIRAGAFDQLGERRTLLWTLGDIDEHPNGFALESTPTAIELPELSAWEKMLWEYELLGFSPAGHLLRHYRAGLQEQGVMATWEVKKLARAGQRVSVGGMIVVKQKPETAKGILFMSLEDESGLVDLIVKPLVYANLKLTLRNHLIVATGIVQRVEGTVSVLVQEATALN